MSSQSSQTVVPVSQSNPTKKTCSKDQEVEGRKVIKGCTTKSSQIRSLAAAGWSMGDTARFLSIVHRKTFLFQHVRNVLNQPVKNPIK